MNHGLKSDKLHHYQKRVYPFWRRPENTSIYSEKVKEEFELKKLEFDVKARYLQWETRR